MFSSLTEKLELAFKKLRGQAKISESNVTDAMEDIRMALLDADVDFKVAKDLVTTVKAQAIGAEVLRTVSPGQQIVKIFHDELVKILGEAAPLSLDPPQRILMTGLNGAGKTTLFRMINGLETPDGGALKIGDTVQISYQDQSRTLEGKRTLWEEISGGRETITVGKREMNSRAYAASFNFKGADQQKLVANLSGGERNRLHLAKTVLQGGNLLLLDEPTNDLDVDTLRALEDAVLDFSGCAVIISHDRWFLDRVATHILAFEGDSETVWFEGNYGAYIEDLKRRKGPDADMPTRIKYKKLVRS